MLQWKHKKRMAPATNFFFAVGITDLINAISYEASDVL